MISLVASSPISIFLTTTNLWSCNQCRAVPVCTREISSPGLTSPGSRREPLLMKSMCGVKKKCVDKLDPTISSCLLCTTGRRQIKSAVFSAMEGFLKSEIPKNCNITLKYQSPAKLSGPRTLMRGRRAPSLGSHLILLCLIPRTDDVVFFRDSLVPKSFDLGNASL